MNKVKRSDLLDYVTYTEQREDIRRQMLDIKASRRIHVGPYLTFLFENRDTIRYQIQEMMRLEQMVKESEIKHEMETYNQILGEAGELGCTLLIEIADADLRAKKLVEWLPVMDRLYLKLEDGRRIPATYDPKQIGEGKLSSVQYLKFNTGGAVPVAIGADWQELTVETPLTGKQRQALARDLAGGAREAEAALLEEAAF